MCGCTYMYVWVCACIWKPEVSPTVILQALSTLVLRQGPSLAWNMPIRQGWMQSDLGIHLSPPPMPLGLQIHSAVNRFFIFYFILFYFILFYINNGLGVELRSSCLQNKRLPTEPSPQSLIFLKSLIFQRAYFIMFAEMIQFPESCSCIFP